MVSTFARGQFFESLVVRYYSRLGFRYIGRNVYIGRKEIDIIMQIEDLVVFIEVKSGSIFTNPYTVLSKAKIQNLYSSSIQYVSRNDISNYRIDYVFVSSTKELILTILQGI